MSDEWVHQVPPPPLGGRELLAWTAANQVRRIRCVGGWWQYTDCQHPQQNMFCDVSRVLAWRLPTGAKP